MVIKPFTTGTWYSPHTTTHSPITFSTVYNWYPNFTSGTEGALLFWSCVSWGVSNLFHNMCVCFIDTQNYCVDQSSRTFDLKEHLHCYTCMWYVIMIQDHRYLEHLVQRRFRQHPNFQSPKPLTVCRTVTNCSVESVTERSIAGPHIVFSTWKRSSDCRNYNIVGVCPGRRGSGTPFVMVRKMM
jgi:hypothetical protein